MINYIKKFKNNIDYFFLNKINPDKLVFNIRVKIDKINNFLELKNIFDKNNFLWSGDWDKKKLNLNLYRKYSPSYNSAFQIFHEHLNYKESEEYKIKSKLILNGKKSGRGQTLNELENYFISLEKLKLSLKEFGYKSQMELNNFNKKNDEIGVVVGKNWEIIKLQDKFGGTHRFALCKILNIREIVVSVRAIHQSLLEKEELKIIFSKNYNYSKEFLKKKLLQNI